MKIKSLVEIKGFLQEIATPLNVTVADVEFKQGKNPALTVFIDKNGGVDLDTCELFHRAIDAPLDELDPTFGQAYTLNVSSPGIDRPIVTDKDFTRNSGEELEVNLYEPILKKKTLVGRLVAFSKDSVILEIKNENLEIERKKISKATKFINF